MEASPDLAPAAAPTVAAAGLARPARHALDARLARVVSSLLSPPALGAAALVLVSQLAGAASAWGWAAVYLLLAVGLPMLYVGWLVWRGQVTDFELMRREQRIRPFLATLSGMAAGWCLLRLGHAPHLLAALAAASMAQAALLLAITLHWKISIHTASIGALAVLLLAALGPAAVPMLALVPLVGWARVRLGRHTPAQVLAGAALGMLSMLAALWLSA